MTAPTGLILTLHWIQVELTHDIAYQADTHPVAGYR